MKVKELIAKLQEFDYEKEILCDSDDGEYYTPTFIQLYKPVTHRYEKGKSWTETGEEVILMSWQKYDGQLK